MVEGKRSEALRLVDMVYQGTVFGPTLWNLFYADCSRAILKCEFTEVVYADDLNAFKEFEGSKENEDIVEEVKECQLELHRWGAANQVSFDPAKESMHVISHVDPSGDDFRILGVKFDCRLQMAAAVSELVVEARWKLRSLLRATRFFTTAEQVLHYKSRVLSYLEYRTPAVYHACRTVLDRLDAVQRSFIREIGISAEEALLQFNLAPLEARRDIAMLGVIHRAVLKQGPAHLHKFFRVQVPQPPVACTRQATRRHGKQLVDLRSVGSLEIVSRSAHGLVAVYNLLPADVVDLGCVSAFQAVLQCMLKDRASQGAEGWACMFCPRLQLYQHPLRTYKWKPSLLLPVTGSRWALGK